MGLAARILVVLVWLSAGLGMAHAQVDILPEVRTGILSHDVGNGTNALLDPQRISDANVELLFSLGDLSNILVVAELRPHIGATLNFKGEDSFAYAGLSLTAQLPLLPVFIEASLGGAAHGTPFATSTTPAPPRFGCVAVARAAASVGVNVLPGASIIGTVEHYSDGGLCGTPNDGVTNVGLRIGFRF
ncbi:acyloxyacyl hydrolase [Devosia rhodophyticola]|uniref:Acyloxyacyl hydrolase n=1 Tax=Devosia rhodophyticola TaxID=3026423 RepID=A0ABY7YT18_9HYPH|nr:acyloxyacyl hydrolase [Devosia rhodophyticola]WDR04451.1 acyloxyacyl hydrolase [Devosia rhodophyticola]